MAGLFQLPSLIRMLVCKARTKREWELSRTQSLGLVWPETLLRNSSPVIVVHSPRSQCYRKTVEAWNLPSHALLLALVCSHNSASFAWVKCVRILSPYSPHLRRCSERFLNIYRKFLKMFPRSPNVAEDAQRLLKVSKDSYDTFGHSK